MAEAIDSGELELQFIVYLLISNRELYQYVFQEFTCPFGM